MKTHWDPKQIHIQVILKIIPIAVTAPAKIHVENIRSIIAAISIKNKGVSIAGFLCPRIIKRPSVQFGFQFFNPLTRRKMIG